LASRRVNRRVCARRPAAAHWVCRLFLGALVLPFLFGKEVDCAFFVRRLLLRSRPRRPGTPEPTTSTTTQRERYVKQLEKELKRLREDKSSHDNSVFSLAHFKKHIEEAVAEAYRCDEAEKKLKIKDLRMCSDILGSFSL
jgi:hypothetical protein